MTFIFGVLTFLAATGIKPGDVNIPKASGGIDQVTTIMDTIVFPIAGTVALLFIIIGSLRYVLSQGEANNLKQAKEMIIYALVGLVLVASSFAILQLVIKIGEG